MPNEYLSYMFGWRQLYKDVMDLLATPDKVTRRMNYLIRQSGKRSIVRVKRTIPLETVPSSISFIYPTSMYESNITSGYTLRRSGEIRVVLDTTFSFPDVMSPRFRREYFLRELGVLPSPLDLYNLVPWTWLVDWFTGLNQYVESISIVNSDRNLVNSCMITVDMLSTFSHIRTWIEDRNVTIKHGPPTYNNSYVQKTKRTHTSELDVFTQVRRDISTSLQGVRSTAVPSTLTAFQQSILGALLLQRTKFPR